MTNLTITTFHHPTLENILAPGERLLWSGQPSYGRRFFQAVGAERTFHIGFLIGTIVMWSTLPFIETEPRFGRNEAIWIYSAVSIGFFAVSYALASQRHYVLFNLVYFISDRRAIVCRRGRNWRLSTQLYVISCPHSEFYPYSVISSRPYPSLQVGTLLSENQLQPLGLGLSHPGQPVLWGRITAPVVIEYVPNAQELLELIQSCTESCLTEMPSKPAN